MRGLTAVAPPPFRYVRPESLDDALAAMSAPHASVLAGGTDLVTLRAGGLLAPEALVDIKTIPELRGMGGETSRMLGAATTMRELSETTVPGLDALVDGARLVGGAQTRARATLGGNVVRASPAGDTLCGLLVLDACLHLRSVDGHRALPASEFFAGPGRNLRYENELLTAVEVPLNAGGSSYDRFTYRNAMDLAVVGVAANLSCRDGVCSAASIAIGAVGPVPLLVPDAAGALIGSGCDPHAIEAACAALLDVASPIDDVRGTRRHRLRVLPVLARRVIERAWDRAVSRTSA
jgi:CO/xanthine dehydrogenase FAD-binding subunit